MCLLTVAATEKLPKSFEFPKHGHIRDSQYPFESGAVGAFSCFTNTSLYLFEKDELDALNAASVEINKLETEIDVSFFELMLRFFLYSRNNHCR